MISAGPPKQVAKTGRPEPIASITVKPIAEHLHEDDEQPQDSDESRILSTEREDLLL